MKKLKKIRIISGVQTGADKAGFDAAVKGGFTTGGVAPNEFMTENGYDPDWSHLALRSERCFGTKRQRGAILVWKGIHFLFDNIGAAPDAVNEKIGTRG